MLIQVEVGKFPIKVLVCVHGFFPVGDLMLAMAAWFLEFPDREEEPDDLAVPAQWPMSRACRIQSRWKFVCFVQTDDFEKT